MKTRFEGSDGRRRLIGVLMTQRLVEHDNALAERLADEGELVILNAGDVMIEQNSADNDLYFIIEGEVSVVVNKRNVATRAARDSVGEMALVDGSARRSATVVAAKPVCALKLAESRFHEIAVAFPRIWRSIAVVVAERLRQRARFHRPPNERPILFIGSSVEGLAVAKEIQLGLKHSSLVARLWTNSVFGPGGVTIDALLAQVDCSDFALFVFGPDDKITSRDEKYRGPRDNVVFELGLYMGRLDRDRCYIVKEHSSDIKIPSDLLGVTPITYICKPGADLTTAISTVCTEVETVVARLGVR